MSYKNIVFAKLEKRLLNDPRWWTMSDLAQLNYIKLILTACETYNRIPKETVILKKMFRSDQSDEVILSTIAEIKKNFPKFQETPEHYCFEDFEEKTNYRHQVGYSPGNPEEILGKSLGGRIPIPISRKEKEGDTKKSSKKPPTPKHKVLEFVYLTQVEADRLRERLGDKDKHYVQRLNGYIGQIGEKAAKKKYTSHYHTILNWARMDGAHNE